MSFYSLQFVVFLAALLACYYAVGRFAKRGQWIVLLVGSLAFYLTTGWQNLFFILLTSVSTWIVGLAFAKLDAQCDEARKAAADRKEKKAIKARFKHRKWLVLLAVMILNFGVLGYIKYWNTLLAGFGADNTFLASQLLLPLGISFYTCQSIGYTIDLYNGKYAPERNYAKYLVFVSWFPQLIQGPINRFDDMATQLYERHSFDLETTRCALLLIGFGLLKKYVMADTLVTTISTALDNMGVNTPGSVVVYGILLYTIQQYGDFSGGIDMVEGVSELFGIEMGPNFRQPYFSVSLADFWTRWHISLGAWMRDYVFYPLALTKPFQTIGKKAGARFGKHIGRTAGACIANVIVFLLVGLWHGAQAHYLVWGLYNGVIVALADLFKPLFDRMAERFHVDREGTPWHIVAIIRTFIVVTIGRYFDCMPRVGDALICLRNTVTNFMPVPWDEMLLASGFTKGLIPGRALLCIAVILVIDYLYEKGIDVRERFLALPVLVRFAVYLVLGFFVVSSLNHVSEVGGGFMYANF